MGIELKPLGVGKGKRLQSYHNSYVGWDAIGKFIAWKQGEELPEFTEYQGRLDTEQLKEIRAALDALSQMELSKYKKECRDRVLANPIQTCAECAGVGIVEADSHGGPIYPNFCWKCDGVGVVRDTWNPADSLSMSEVERLSKFLHSVDAVNVC